MENHCNPNCACVVFAKVPDAGTAKTRIMATDGRKKAADVYAELLGCTAQTVADTPYHVAYADSAQPLSLTAVFKTARSFFPQTGATLGKRLKNAFEHLFTNGVNHVVAIGTDCPELEGYDIIHACKLITAGIDIVIGPARDGGYYLIGCGRKGMAAFNATSWGSSSLLEETLAIIKKDNLSYDLLHTLSDIDHMEDYLQWKNSLHAHQYR